MNQQNAKFAYDLLFVSPITGNELRPVEWPDESNDGKFIMIVQDKHKTETWKHTIITEEI